MKIFITGGTGFIGTKLTKRLIEKGHEIAILTRSLKKANPLLKGVLFIEGNPKEDGKWKEEIGKYEVIINLAGENIFGRWTKAKKKEIKDSRILTTRHLVEALSSREGKETTLLSASAIGYYGFHGNEEINEDSQPGDDFLASIGKRWEAEAKIAGEYNVRIINCRFGIVLGKDGGVLQKMLPAFKLYAGSVLGSGEQWFSWIHEEDLIKIFLFLLGRKDISGPINFTASKPVRNKEMTKILSEVLKKPVKLPAAPGFIIKTMMGEFGDLVLKGQRVLPRRLLQEGYNFHFPEIKEALIDIVK